jgi:hypothetical protein
LNLKESYKILGLTPGASEKQIKGAYRKLALRYHPDRNPSREAKQKFEEATEAYHLLMDIKEQPPGESSSREEWVASEVVRRERERMRRQARARREKIRQQEDYFKKPEWHDPILLLKYFFHLLAILFAAAAILLPVLYAILVDPASLAGGTFFIIVGIFLLVYIYQHRKSWLRLGKFRTTREDVFRFIRPQPVENTTERCCYTKNLKADGKPYRIELVKTIDIKIRSFGALDHEAKYKNRVRKVVVPRSLRAQQIHRFSTLAKIVSLLVFLLFFPVESLLWRFIAGLLAGTILSFILLITARVRSRISYLLTPGLLIKGLIWIGALLLISDIGPGFNIQTSRLIYIVIFGLFFLLDMVFDLVMGMFPFYRRLFRPLVKQGPVLESLYNEGYQNYMELPVYSVIYPLFKWIF